jgi:hypothetical protein
MVNGQNSGSNINRRRSMVKTSEATPIVGGQWSMVKTSEATSIVGGQWSMVKTVEATSIVGGQSSMVKTSETLEAASIVKTADTATFIHSLKLKHRHDQITKRRKSLPDQFY